MRYFVLVLATLALAPSCLCGEMMEDVAKISDEIEQLTQDIEKMVPAQAEDNASGEDNNALADKICKGKCEYLLHACDKNKYPQGIKCNDVWFDVRQHCPVACANKAHKNENEKETKPETETKTKKKTKKKTKGETKKKAKGKKKTKGETKTTTKEKTKTTTKGETRETREEEKEENLELTLLADQALLKYGYATASEIDQLIIPGSPTFKKDLQKYQKYAGISPTGKVDEATQKQLHKPRCGDKDKHAGRRFRRWAHHPTRWWNSKWDGTNVKLRWKLENSCSRLTDDVVLKVLREAFKKWSDVTNLEFEETPDEAAPEIKIKFVSKSHGDNKPFDGLNGVLAHAYYPEMNKKSIDGDIHFDDDEEWTALEKPENLWRQRDFMWVAVHEIGHSVGMEHSNVQDSIMYPYYPSGAYYPDLALHEDDITGIKAWYGVKGETKPKELPCTNEQGDYWCNAKIKKQVEGEGCDDDYFANIHCVKACSKCKPCNPNHEDWKDSWDYSCAQYGAKNWCKAGWVPHYGTDGYTGHHCPQCGCKPGGPEKTEMECRNFDRMNNCESNKRRGDCETNTGIRTQWCPQTCQGCGDDIPGYECKVNLVCQTPEDGEGKSWGYYQDRWRWTDGNCQTCADQCTADANCGAVECNINYCKWWKQGTCPKEEQTVKGEGIIHTLWDREESKKGATTCNKQAAEESAVAALVHNKFDTDSTAEAEHAATAAEDDSSAVISESVAGDTPASTATAVKDDNA